MAPIPDKFSALAEDSDGRSAAYKVVPMKSGGLRPAEQLRRERQGAPAGPSRPGATTRRIEPAGILVDRASQRQARGGILQQIAAQMLLVATAATAVVAMLLLSGCGTNSVADPLEGTWHAHTIYLTIDADGQGNFKWPIHVICGTGVDYRSPPCDTLDANGTIHDGGHAHVTLTTRHDSAADGVVSGSSDPATFPNGSLQLRVGTNDVLYLRFATAPAGPSPPYLCGLRTDRSSINCGA